MRRALTGSIVALTLIAVGCGGLELKTTAQVQCEDTIADVVRISEENQNLEQPTILKVYDAKEVSRSATRVECEGDAKLSVGDNRAISFWLEEDADGDRFVGFQGK